MGNFYSTTEQPTKLEDIDWDYYGQKILICGSKNTGKSTIVDFIVSKVLVDEEHRFYNSDCDQFYTVDLNSDRSKLVIFEFDVPPTKLIKSDQFKKLMVSENCTVIIIEQTATELDKFARQNLDICFLGRTGFLRAKESMFKYYGGFVRTLDEFLDSYDRLKDFEFLAIVNRNNNIETDIVTL